MKTEIEKILITAMEATGAAYSAINSAKLKNDAHALRIAGFREFGGGYATAAAVAAKEEELRKEDAVMAAYKAKEAAKNALAAYYAAKPGLA